MHRPWRLLLPALLGALAALGLALPAFAHALPDTMNPATNARLDTAPAHVAITYSEPIVVNRSGIVLLDGTGTPVPTSTDPPPGPKQYSVTPSAPLVPGPYTVAWTSRDAADGHDAAGFYTFVVNGGPVGIVTGSARAQAPAADLLATLTVGTTEDGGSLLGVGLDKPGTVDRVRIRLAGPGIGADLLTLAPGGDGSWALATNDVAVPGAWHADVIVRRHDVADDAQAGFDFTIDPTTGQPQFS
jgi:methionine-rich copper-binding protein CopC